MESRSQGSPGRQDSCAPHGQSGDGSSEPSGEDRGEGQDSGTWPCAIENGIKLRRFPADWVKFGKSAGFIRNNQMLEYIQENGCECAVLAFWDGKSHGTKHTITTAKKRGIETVIYRVEEREDKQ